MRLLVAANLACAIAIPGPARAEGAEAAPARPRIALEGLRSTGVAPVLRDLVEERVCTAIGEASRADVVCPSDVAAVAAAARSQLMFGECRSDECLGRVDAFRSADRRVSGALERGEDGLVLSLQLAGPEGPGPRIVEKLPEDLDALVARVPAVVKKLFP